MNFNKICTLFGFLLLNVTLFSQTASIDIVSFNSTATYGPGSGVSVHINPMGIYDMGNPSTLGIDDPVNNKFVLELSDNSGDFGTAVVISEVYGFYTPLLNGLLPDGVSGTYRLRVRATNGLTGYTIPDPEDESQLPSPIYNQVFAETDFFTVLDFPASDYLDVSSGITSINNNFYNCYNQNEGYSIERNDINPTVGSLNRGLGALTNDCLLYTSDAAD